MRSSGGASLRTLAGAGVRVEPGRELLLRRRVERGVGAEVLRQVAHQALPRGRRQQAGRVGHVAGRAFLLVLRQQRHGAVAGRRRQARRGRRPGRPSGRTQASASAVERRGMVVSLQVSKLGRHSGLERQQPASTSAFSAALHSRPTTSLQLRRNHFSVLAASVKRSALKAGASGRWACRWTRACRSAWARCRGRTNNSTRGHGVLVKNAWPRAGTAGGAGLGAVAGQQLARRGGVCPRRRTAKSRSTAPWRGTGLDRWDRVESFMATPWAR